MRDEGGVVLVLGWLLVGYMEWMECIPSGHTHI